MVRGYAARDAVEGWSAKTFKDTRAAALSAFESIQRAAQDALTELKRLHAESVAFDAEYEWHPTILGDFLAMDFGPPSELFTPEELNPLFHILKRRDYWADVENRLQAVVDIPTKRRPGGPTSNTVVAKAVASCRSYWSTLARPRGDGWKMRGLEVAEAGDEFATLEGTAECFLVDALRVSGLDFTADDLRSAWR
jgi:hypothetical protein